MASENGTDSMGVGRECWARGWTGSECQKGLGDMQEPAGDEEEVF